jgi:serine/threonine-protein kinase
MPAAPPPSSERDPISFDLMGMLIGGKYRVRDILGQGGMGTVFEALHEGLGHVVAIKVLHPNQLQKKDSVQRFHQEARSAARIGHPNICEVYDVGTLEDGRPYLVMDRLTGITLADRIQSLGGLPVQEVLDTLTQVLSGLHAAHEKGIIHRDIKPENVFLSQRVGCPPIAKILDFGVSKAMNDSSRAAPFSDVEVTRTGVVLGTPYYLAPEQARGEKNLDIRVDLYACGVMIYEALTGRRPFRAPNYNALLIAILTATPRPVREIRPDLPAGFGRIIEKAMERDAKDRYQTALEFQAALQPYSQNPLAARTVPPSRAPPPRSSAFPPPPDALIPSRVPPSESATAPAPPRPASVVPSRSPSPPRPPRPLSALPPAPLPPRAKQSSVIPPRPVPNGPGTRPSARPAGVGVPTIAVPSVPLAPRDALPALRKHSQNFDDQATDVDLPRQFEIPPRASPDPLPAPAPTDPPKAASMPPPKPASPVPPRPGSVAPPAPPMPARPVSIPPRPGSIPPRPGSIPPPRGVEAFAPRRSAPVLGPPLLPPEKSDDDAATEIMSAAIRSKLPDPAKKRD